MQGSGLHTSHQALHRLMAQEALEPAAQEPDPCSHPPPQQPGSQPAPRAAALSWSTRPPTDMTNHQHRLDPSSAAQPGSKSEAPPEQPSKQQHRHKRKDQQHSAPVVPVEPVISLEEACTLLEDGRALPVERGLVERLMGVVEAGTAWQASALALTGTPKVQTSCPCMCSSAL